MDDTYEKVKAMMVREFNLEADQITPATELASMGVDSLAALEFIFDLESAFGVTLGYEKDMRGAKVQDVVDAVNAALLEQVPHRSAA
jgi:acyl carrier protein